MNKSITSRTQTKINNLNKLLTTLAVSWLSSEFLSVSFPCWSLEKLSYLRVGLLLIVNTPRRSFKPRKTFLLAEKTTRITNEREITDTDSKLNEWGVTLTAGNRMNEWNTDNVPNNWIHTWHSVTLYRISSLILSLFVTRENNKMFHFIQTKICFCRLPFVGTSFSILVGISIPVYGILQTGCYWNTVSS